MRSGGGAYFVENTVEKFYTSECLVQGGGDATN